ncbi:MAG: aldose epimerase family protein [Crocinitomicaceae bacterium]
MVKKLSGGKFFGFLSDGTEVREFTLKNRCGTTLKILNYGATIRSLKLILSSGKKVDVVLGFDHLEFYEHAFQLKNPPYFGCIVGRHVGRVRNAQFPLNGQIIELTKNLNNHHLHGGFGSFCNQIWSLVEMKTEENPFLKLSLFSPAESEGFPGNVQTTVTYRLSESDELSVELEAHSDKDTLLNLAQHNYFNLNGHKRSVNDLELKISADSLLETDSENVPTGDLLDLKDHSMDYRKAKLVPESVDSTFVLSKLDAVNAMLYSQKNQLKMWVETNQNGLHVFIGGLCGALPGKKNTAYHKQSAICFEAQNFPDAPNHAHFPSSILKKGEKYYNTCRFKFERI